MRVRIAVALFVSVLLIGTAFWSRSNPSQGENELIALGVEDEFEQEFLQDFLEPDVVGTAATNASTETPINTLGKQLLIDYINYANTGEVSVIEVADKYIETLPSLLTYSEVSEKDFNVVSDSRSILEKYALEVENIRKEYAKAVNEAYPKENPIENKDSGLQIFASASADAYKIAADKLRATSVPKSFLTYHRDLVNTYYSSAVAMEALANVEGDSASAFAGLVKVNENIAKENSILREMNNIFTLRTI